MENYMCHYKPSKSNILPPMSTHEDIYNIIQSTYSEPTATSVWGIYNIFKNETPDEKPINIFLHTLDYVISIYENNKDK